MDRELQQLAIRLNQVLIGRGLSMASAESCTGGWIAKAMTDVPGSSGCFERAFVTYCNVAKQEMLGVAPATLDSHGAVSEQVVREMVQGALDHSHASVAVAVSGIAGPDGGSDGKPVGTVWLAWAGKGMATVASREQFSGGREAVRYRSTITALLGVLNLIE